MQYRKVALEIVVGEEEAEILLQALSDAMDQVEKAGDRVCFKHQSYGNG